MRFLFVLDPLKKLDLDWDTSLTILSELANRGHQCFAADAPDFWIEGKKAGVRAVQIVPGQAKNSWDYVPSSERRASVKEFDLIFVRKNPPFDSAYLDLTYVLELAAEEIPVINDPRGIRDTNEKLSTLNFPHWIPETLAASSPRQILEFQKKIKDDLVIKPLDQKGGEGVFLLRQNEAEKEAKLRQATQQGNKFLLAQRFIRNTFSPGEKRILILDGKYAGAYEKRPAPGDFRANLSLKGAAFHPAALTKSEEKLVGEVGKFLRLRRLYFAGIDVLNERLIEINVTSPAGICEVMSLQPETRLAEKAAGFLESRAARREARVR